jgi:hypothetical protein
MFSSCQPYRCSALLEEPAVAPGARNCAWRLHRPNRREPDGIGLDERNRWWEYRHILGGENAT